MRRLIIAGLFAGTASLPAFGQTLMSCEVTGIRGSGENVEIVYNERNCRPVTSAEVLRADGTGDNATAVYGSSQRSALGGGPVYIMRFGNSSGERGSTHYGAPLDGNVGTVGR